MQQVVIKLLESVESVFSTPMEIIVKNVYQAFTETLPITTADVFHIFFFPPPLNSYSRLLLIYQILACNCNPLGTEENSALNCDQTTGQCNCLPNVVGVQCSSCKLDHYGMQSGTGCTDCSCDVDGTINRSTSCHGVSYCNNNKKKTFFNSNNPKKLIT